MGMVEVWKTLNGDYISASGLMSMPKDYSFVCASNKALAEFVITARRDEDIYVVKTKDRNGRSVDGGIWAPAKLIDEQRVVLNSLQPMHHTMGRAKRKKKLLERDVKNFCDLIKKQFPGCPATEAMEIARATCKPGTGRIGRTKELDDPVRAAVVAYIRHVHTDYDERLFELQIVAVNAAELEDAKQAARSEVRAKIKEVIKAWQVYPVGDALAPKR